jgi:integrase
MASIEQRAGGTYRARVRRNGAPDLSRSFARREDAEIWSADTEAAIRSGTLQSHKLKRTTLGELLAAYGDSQTPRKRGAKQEYSRIAALLRDSVAAYSLENLSRAVFRSFRDRRLKSVSGSTLNRDLALLSVTLAWARAEMDAPVDAADLLGGLKEPENPARTRRLEPGEEQRLLDAAPPWLRDYITLALETTMRRSELAALEWHRVDLNRRVAVLLTSKNNHGRKIPLSGVAIRTLERMPRNINGRLFDMHVDVITSNFIDACRRAGIEGLRLHDLRAEGVSRLSERGFDLGSIKAISGHKSMIVLRYLRPGDTEALAQRLA